MKRLSRLWTVIRKSATGFNDDNAFKLSASLSYYTIFAMGPLLIILISLSGIFFGRAAIQGKVYSQINGLVGNSAAIQIQDIIRNIEQTKHTRTGAILGVVMLLVGATGVFTEIQGSINYIWSVQAKPKKGWLKLLLNRLLSFSLIVSLGFILMVSLIVNSLMDLLSAQLKNHFAGMTVYFFYVVNVALIFICITALFTVMYKVLPDAVIRWKDALIGAVFTSVFFLLGKLLIGLYIGNSNIGLTYGAAASVMVILLWVYYSSLILFFGAEFTKIHAIYFGGGIKPSATAVFIIKREVKEMNPEIHAASSSS